MCCCGEVLILADLRFSCWQNSIKPVKSGLFFASACFSSASCLFLCNFSRLKATAKMAKSIMTLSVCLSLKWRKRLYPLLDFDCPKTASGSMGRLLRCINPSSDVRHSRALFLRRSRLWLISSSGSPLPCGISTSRDKPRSF